MSTTENNDSLSVENNRSDLPRTIGFIVGFFGIFFLVIGFFSLLSFAVTEMSSLGDGPLGDKEIYSLILIITSIIISLSAMFIGLQLIKRRTKGRKLFNVLTVFIIFTSIAQYTYNQFIIAKSFSNMPPELAAAARGSESSASLIVFILPCILISIAVILNLPKMRKSLH